MNNRKSIIYIAGNVRSGSTLLERILSTEDNVVGLGELHHLLKVDLENTVCSCGEKLNNCIEWAEIKKTLDYEEKKHNKIKDIQLKSESLKSILKFIQNKNDNYKIYCNEVIKKIFKSTSSNTQYIIDSSKNSIKCFFRPMLLKKYSGHSIKVVHIIRNGRGCMYSHLNRFGNNNIQAVKSSLKWLIANISATLFHYLSKENYIMIKYDNLVNNPIKVINDLSIFLQIDLSKTKSLLKNNYDIPLTHQFKANPIRNKENLIIDNKVGFKWKKNTKITRDLIFYIITWPFLLYSNFIAKKDG